MTDQGSVTEVFRSARDFLLRHRTDYAAARREFSWPRLDKFNWALDWFDVLALEHPERLALWIVTEDAPDTKLSYAELSVRSDQVTTWLRGLGVGRGDPDVGGSEARAACSCGRTQRAGLCGTVSVSSARVGGYTNIGIGRVLLGLGADLQRLPRSYSSTGCTTSLRRSNQASRAG